MNRGRPPMGRVHEYDPVIQAKVTGRENPEKGEK